ncbi:MAG: hypothetical protein P8Y71_03635, partial [Pseudolabrys sp.]
MPQGDEPRAEPEIIPPDRAGRDKHRKRTFTDAYGNERIYVAQVSPVGSILVVLVAAILLAVMLVLLLGALMIWLPVLVFFVAGAFIVAIVRAYFKRG